jgi:hypothetical protein
MECDNATWQGCCSLTCIPFSSEGLTGTLGIRRSSKTSGSIAAEALEAGGADLRAETAS